MTKKLAVGYARVASTKQAMEGLTLSTQEKKIHEWCHTNNYELVNFFTDIGLSGYDFDNRPSIQAALMACDKGTALITFSLSRLTRNIKDLIEITQQLTQKSADLISVSEHIDTTKSPNNMVFKILSIIAEFESNTNSERISLALQAKKSKGEYTGGYIPYGYKLSSRGKQLIKNKSEQTIITLAKNWRKQGLTLESIANNLYLQGYLTRNNKKFSPTQISRLLT